MHFLFRIKLELFLLHELILVLTTNEKMNTQVGHLRIDLQLICSLPVCRLYSRLCIPELPTVDPERAVECLAFGPLNIIVWSALW